MATKLNDLFEGCNDSCNFSTSGMNEINPNTENNSKAVESNLIENPLIPIVEEDGRRAVNARDLHKFLESKQDFSTWIKSRIEKYELIENEDYVFFHKFVEKSERGRPSIEYALSLDAAKELSMVEGNEKGRMARKYFIACEKKLKEKESAPRTYLEALKALVAAEEEKERLRLEAEAQRKTIEEQAPKVGYYDELVERGNNTNIRDTAKELKLGQNEFVRLMISWGILYRDARKKLKPTAEAMEKGLCVLKEFTNQTNGHTGNQTMFTVDGKSYIRKRMISKR